MYFPFTIGPVFGTIVAKIIMADKQNINFSGDTRETRTPERLRAHYEAEKRLASRLRSSTREERKTLYKTLYNELFQQVPDHPRLTAPADPARLDAINRNKLKFLHDFIRPEFTVVEFAPGDCSFARVLAREVRRVVAVDISDQRPEPDPVPANLELVIYNGYELDLPESCADLVFSDQLVEHLHPEDVVLHFKLALHLLKPGGVYLFRTPHKFSGPHDISRFFSAEAEGFHLKEWTCAELAQVMFSAGYGQCFGCLAIHNHYFKMPLQLCVATEKVAMNLPEVFQRPIVKNRFKQIIMGAVKKPDCS